MPLRPTLVGQQWVAALGPAEAATVTSRALETADRLRDRSRVTSAIRVAERQTHFPESIRWEPVSIAHGDAGLALLCAQLASSFPDDGWDVSGHHLLAAAVVGAERARDLPLGAFTGLSGVAFAAWALARSGLRYRRLLRSLDDTLLPQVIAEARALENMDGMPVGAFDVISGASGIGAYLLCRRQEPRVAETLDAILTGLVALSDGDGGRRRFRTPSRFLPADMAAVSPYGNLNCGLAHGVPGLLALLALAYRTGARVPGQGDAINRLGTWLVRHRTHDRWGVSWPTFVPLDADGVERPTSDREPSRTAWCYGSPGIARALWLAGDALSQPHLQTLAVEAMDAVFRRPVTQRGIDSPTFCHGVAGLLQITLRFAHDTGLPAFTAQAAALARQISDHYEEDSILGFRSLEPGGNRVEQPGLLDGVPGVVLTLLAASMPGEPIWDRLFLLA